MNKWTATLGCFACLVPLAATLVGCGVQRQDAEVDVLGTSGTPVVVRRVTVEADGCSLDPWQDESLASAAMKRVVTEVILMCLVPREDGTVGPDDDSSRTAIKATTATLHDLGYKVSLGIAFTDEEGVRFDGVQTASWLSNEGWRTSVISSIGTHQDEADGFDLDVERLPDAARQELTDFVGELGAAVRPASTLGIFVLPSTQSPSDVSGGNAFDVLTLASAVDRVRVATLDFSVGSPGPTIDSGWAVDALNFAKMSTRSTPVDIAAPLYGWDFRASTQRSVTYDEAIGLLDLYKAPLTHSPGGEPTFSYTDDNGDSHVLFYDDAASTLTTLRAWNAATVPSDVGLVLWGFGAEDPSVWNALSAATPAGGQ